MGDKAQDFDLLLSSFLQRAKAENGDSRLSQDMPVEVAGEDLQLLQLALDIRRQMAPSKPDPDFIKNSQIRLTNQLRGRVKREPSVSPRKTKRAVPWWGRLLKPIPVLASLMLVLALTLGSVGVVGASAASLPGDAFYPVKRGWEQARLALSLNPASDAALLASFANERIEEIEALAGMDRPADLDQAVGDFLDLSDQLSELAEDPDSGATELQTELANNVEVLQRVLEQVPAQAQPAIERAIERSLEREAARQRDQLEDQQEKPGQGQGKPADRPGQGRNQNEAQNQRTAEQIAEQYTNGDVVAVRAQFEGACDGDWQCVREHFRVQQQNRRTAEQIARQNGIGSEEVMGIYEGTCNFDWKCVRDFFRENRPGGGPPEDLPNDK